MSMRVISAIARADFLERVRRHSFYFTLGFSGLLASAVYTQQIVLRLGDYRGIYNSAWFGALMALISTLFLSLAGFYVVRNSIQRDEQTNVGGILAATTLGKSSYTYGKALSNFLVLLSQVAVLAASAVLMQLMRGDHTLDFWPLFSPFLLAALPVMVLVAGLAVVFEAVPLLRTAFGNAVYFFLWMGLLSASITLPRVDLFCLGSYMRSMQAALIQVHSSYRPGFTFQIGVGEAQQQFEWNGVHWTSMMVLIRLVWVASALLLPALAAFCFNRFDPASQPRTVNHRPASEFSIAARNSPTAKPVPLHSLTARPKPTSFLRLTIPQLRLMLTSASRWWYLVAIGLFVATLATPPTVSRNILSFAWLWPLSIWSQMGTREYRYFVFPLIFTSANMSRAYVPAVWLSGFIVAVAAGCGTAVRLLQAGDAHGLLSWVAGACFIPSLALALGVLTSTGTAFEAVYIVWWYIGVLSHVPYLDFTSSPPHSVVPYIYFLLSAIFAAIAYVRRQFQLETS